MSSNAFDDRGKDEDLDEDIVAKAIPAPKYQLSVTPVKLEEQTNKELTAGRDEREKRLRQDSLLAVTIAKPAARGSNMTMEASTELAAVVMQRERRSSLSKTHFDDNQSPDTSEPESGHSIRRRRVLIITFLVILCGGIALRAMYASLPFLGWIGGSPPTGTSSVDQAPDPAPIVAPDGTSSIDVFSAKIRRAVSNSGDGAIFTAMMWKLCQNCEPKDDREEWLERSVWISKSMHFYYHSKHNERGQLFFDHVVQDLKITVLPPGTSFFEHTVRVEGPIDGQEVYLATDDKDIITRFLVVTDLRGEGSGTKKCTGSSPREGKSDSKSAPGKPIGIHLVARMHQRLLVARRVTRIRHKLQRTLQSRSKSAGAVGALIANNKALDEQMREASQRFRCVSWNVLKKRRDIICAGGTLDEVGRGTDDLHLLARLCELSGCDAFISHSWRDDPEIKWAKLKAWCEEFFTEHGRPVTLWLDKLCIDQQCIALELECLPIFLAGCNTMLVLAGESYTTRLWCMLEMYVYMVMRAQAENDEGDEHEQGIVVVPVVNSMASLDDLREKWDTFDAADCDCYNKNDKEKVLELIGKHGGIAEFNDKVGALLRVAKSNVNRRNALMTTLISVPMLTTTAASTRRVKSGLKALRALTKGIKK
jgi:hypothetical protein